MSGNFQVVLRAFPRAFRSPLGLQVVIILTFYRFPGSSKWEISFFGEKCQFLYLVETTDRTVVFKANFPFKDAHFLPKLRFSYVLSNFGVKF